MDINIFELICKMKDDLTFEWNDRKYRVNINHLIMSLCLFVHSLYQHNPDTSVHMYKK